MFSWIAKGFENVVNSIKESLNFLGEILEYINPLSEKFFLKDFFEFIGDALSYINPFDENFIFKEFFENIFNWLNPFSEDFILKKLWVFLTDIIDYLNPFSENFLGKKLIELLGELLQKLFVPSEERLQAIPNTIASKFGFVDSIKIAINSFKDIVNNLGNAPSITLNLGATKYTNEMNMKVIDMSFYKAFKPYGDLVITGFVYIFYLWRLFVNISNILNGVPNLYDVSSQKDDIEAYNRFGFGRRNR